jgi:hypothetical protein
MRIVVIHICKKGRGMRMMLSMYCNEHLGGATWEYKVLEGKGTFMDTYVIPEFYPNLLSIL